MGLLRAPDARCPIPPADGSYRLPRHLRRLPGAGLLTKDLAATALSVLALLAVAPGLVLGALNLSTARGAGPTRTARRLLVSIVLHAATAAAAALAATVNLQRPYLRPGLAAAATLALAGVWWGDLRSMMVSAMSLREADEPGRCVVRTAHGSRPGEVIVEPDRDAQLLVVVTAYPLVSP
jgi:hypothetical protein